MLIMHQRTLRFLISRWLVYSLSTYVALQLLLFIITLSSSSTSNSSYVNSNGVFKGKYGEPSQYADPENSYPVNQRSRQVSVLHIFWHTVKHNMLSNFHSLFGKRGEYFNSWDSITEEEYYKPRSHIISKTDYPFIIEGDTICPPDKMPPFIMVTIQSIWKSRQIRDTIRQSWASGKFECDFMNTMKSQYLYDKFKDKYIQYEGDLNTIALRNAVRHVFVFGVPENETERVEALEYLKRENVIYNDIVVSDFYDNYRNLSIKSLTGLRWAQRYCPNVELVVKTDEDVFLYVPKLFQQMLHYRKSNAIMGPAFTDGVGCSVFRTSRYAVPYKAYPFSGGFPPHVKGGIYIIPLTIATKLVEVAPYMPYVSIEDVFVTGILRKSIGADIKELPPLLYKYERFEPAKEVKEYIKGNRMATHGLKWFRMLQYFYNVTLAHDLCKGLIVAE